MISAIPRPTCTAASAHRLNVFVQIKKCICSKCNFFCFNCSRNLFKSQDVFFQFAKPYLFSFPKHDFCHSEIHLYSSKSSIAQCICSNHEMYLFKLLNVFVQFFLNMISAIPRSTCTAARAETPLKTAAKAFRHEPIDDRIQTAETLRFCHF